MRFIINKTTGEMRPHAPTLGPLTSAPLAEGEILIDTLKEVYNPATGEVLAVTPRISPANLPARIASLETRLAQLETRLQAVQQSESGKEGILAPAS